MQAKRWMLAVLGMSLALSAEAGRMDRQARREGRAGNPAANEKRWERWSSRFDADKDGKVTKDEFVSAAPMGARMDKNSDGVITRAEVGDTDQDRNSRAADNFFAQVDTDKDGKVTKAEVAKVAETRFARFDKDKNGTVTKEEFLSVRAERRSGQADPDVAAPAAPEAPEAPATR